MKKINFCHILFGIYVTLYWLKNSDVTKDDAYHKIELRTGGPRTRPQFPDFFLWCFHIFSTMFHLGDVHPLFGYPFIQPFVNCRSILLIYCMINRQNNFTRIVHKLLKGFLKHTEKKIYISEPQHDKTNKMSVCPAKTQISLGIHPAWSESSLSAWRNLGSLATHWVHSKDSDQTLRMPWLIWVFTGLTLILLILSYRSSYMQDKI